MSFMPARRLSLASRLWREEEGQDLLEYALLTGIIGISSIVLITTVVPTMAAAYQAWNTAQENVWEPNPPLP
jgi:Flp pilus assembly pilin Flp